MIDTERINNRISQKGMTHRELAEYMGMSQARLNLKINNQKVMYLDEAEKLQEILEIPNDSFREYFFYN